MNWDINEVIEAAIALEIKITNAECGTEICQCWEDRVMDAMNAWNREDMVRCQELIDEANRYAI